MNLIDLAIQSQGDTLYGNLWNNITDMFEKDNIDYFNEKDSLRLVTSTDGNTILMYKGNPYCTWNNPSIEFGLRDELNTTVRATIILRKF